MIKVRLITKMKTEQNIFQTTWLLNLCRHVNLVCTYRATDHSKGENIVNGLLGIEAGFNKRFTSPAP